MGLLVTYPMKAANREKEKNPHVITDLLFQHSFDRHIDLKPDEKPHRGAKALEGTGSLLFDKSCGKVYVSWSQRADKTLLDSLLSKMEEVAVSTEEDK